MSMGDIQDKLRASLNEVKEQAKGDLKSLKDEVTQNHKEGLKTFAYQIPFEELQAEVKKLKDSSGAESSQFNTKLSSLEEELSSLQYTIDEKDQATNDLLTDKIRDIDNKTSKLSSDLEN